MYLSEIFLVENVKCLDENGTNDKEISELRRKAYAFLRTVRSIVWIEDVPQKSKEMVYRRYYIPMSTYASETWVWRRKI